MLAVRQALLPHAVHRVYARRYDELLSAAFCGDTLSVLANLVGLRRLTSPDPNAGSLALTQTPAH